MQHKRRILSHIEQNAVRHTAGYVVRKLIEKNKFDNEINECLKSLLLQNGDEISDDTSTQWLQTTDRGGLYHVTDEAFEFFTEIELVTYNYLTKMNIDSVKKTICDDPYVLHAWADCSIDIESSDKQNYILMEIIKEWVKLRGHSIASMEEEQHKKKKAASTKKKRSLRKELERRQTATS